MKSVIEEKFNSYPLEVRDYLIEIRQLIFTVASDEGLGQVSETLKWGEPSYSTKKGSPIRIDWKAKAPEQVSIYFNCKTLLLETFREVYRDKFHYVANRELVLSISDPIANSSAELAACISMALRYHSIKNLPLLGK